MSKIRKKENESVSFAVKLERNSANYANGALWNGPQSGITTVGSNGGPSYYGTYDQCGNAQEMIDFEGTNKRQTGGNWATRADLNAILMSKNRWSATGSYGAGREQGFRVVTALNPLNLSNFVHIGNAGNANDTTGLGGVNYEYLIGKYEVTNAEYAEYLNSIAATDIYGNFGPYHVYMGTDVVGGIIRSGVNGAYTYAVKPNMGNKPVVFMSWYKCARYCNWLHNGKPVGTQNNNTTENGAYPLFGATLGVGPPKNSGAKYWIPQHNEWYKAAYYDPTLNNNTGGYWTFATRSNNPPAPTTANSAGNGTFPTPRISSASAYPIRAIHVGGAIRLSTTPAGQSIAPTAHLGGTYGDLRVLSTISTGNSITVDISSAFAGQTINYASLEVVLVDADNRIVGWGNTRTGWPDDGAGSPPTNGAGGTFMTLTLEEFPVIDGSWVLNGKNPAFSNLAAYAWLPVQPYKTVDTALIPQ